MTERKPTRQRSVTYDQARAFVTVAHTGSYERAAELLELSSATSVIHLVNRMAATIGRGHLLGPSIRGRVSLTAIGSEVLDHATQLVEAYDTFTENRHEIRFSCYPSAAGRLARTVAEFNAEHSQTQVRFYEVADQSRRDRGEGLLERATTGEIDLVIAPSGHASPELRSHPLYSWKLRVVLPNGDPRRSRTRVTIEDLRGLEFVASPLGHASRRLLDEACSKVEAPPRVTMELVDQYVLARLAREGRRYAAVMPDDAFGEPDPSLGPALVDRERRPYQGKYALYYLDRHHHAESQGSTRSAAVLDFATVVIEELKPARRVEPKARPSRRGRG